jgi:hypothetical protein
MVYKLTTQSERNDKAMELASIMYSNSPHLFEERENTLKPFAKDYI